jgi:hypothetical protein
MSHLMNGVRDPLEAFCAEGVMGAVRHRVASGIAAVFGHEESVD